MCLLDKQNSIHWCPLVKYQNSCHYCYRSWCEWAFRVVCHTQCLFTERKCMRYMNTPHLKLVETQRELRSKISTNFSNEVHVEGQRLRRLEIHSQETLKQSSKHCLAKLSQAFKWFKQLLNENIKTAQQGLSTLSPCGILKSITIKENSVKFV